MPDLKKRLDSIIDSAIKEEFRKIDSAIESVSKDRLRAVEFSVDSKRSEYVQSVSIRMSAGVNVDDHCDILLTGHHVCRDYEPMTVAVGYGKLTNFKGRYFITSWEYSYSDGEPVTRIKGGTLLFALNNWPSDSKTYRKGQNYRDIIKNVLRRSGAPLKLMFQSFSKGEDGQKILEKYGFKSKDVNLQKNMEHKVTETYAQFISKLARSSGDPDGFLFYVNANEQIFFEKELVTDWEPELSLKKGVGNGLDQLISYSVMSSRVGKVDSIKRIGNPTAKAKATEDISKEETIKIFYSSSTDIKTGAKADVTVKPRVQKIANSQKSKTLSKGIKQKLTTARLEFDGIVYVPVNRVLLIEAGFEDESPVAGRFVVTGVSMFADDSSLTTSITAKKESTVSSHIIAQEPNKKDRDQTSKDKSSEKGSQSTYGTITK